MDAFLTLEIGNKTYGLEVIDATEGRTVRLTKGDGTTYDVTEGTTRTVCDCPDFTHRHATLDYSEGCKHVQATVKAGLVENVKPVAPVDVPATDQSVALTERYRPRTLADMVGQGEIVFQLRSFAEAPASQAFIFAGGTGVGKTTAAIAFATELGVDVAEGEWGGLYEIRSGEQHADTVRETFAKFRARPFSGSGWRAVIVSEADRMNATVGALWCDLLETLPSQTVVIFTTNRLYRIASRLVHRCESYTFRSDAATLLQDAQHRVNEIWQRETGRTDAPRVADLPGAIDGGELSIRAAIQALNPLIRSARRGVSPVATSKPAALPIGSAKRAGRWDHVDFASLASRYTAGEGLSDLSRETGCPAETIHGRLKKMGVAFRGRSAKSEKPAKIFA